MSRSESESISANVLSKKIGTVLISQLNFGDLTNIKRVFAVLFPNALELVTCLNDPNLWLLYQRRHLIVHRRGIVDETYLERSGGTR